MYSLLIGWIIISQQKIGQKLSGNSNLISSLYSLGGWQETVGNNSLWFGIFSKLLRQEQQQEAHNLSQEGAAKEYSQRKLERNLDAVESITECEKKPFLILKDSMKAQHFQTCGKCSEFLIRMIFTSSVFCSKDNQHHIHIMQKG